MTLEAPRLDDRNFNDILEEALRLIPVYCPEWTDFSPSDPGITLVELFAWMTDLMLYRMNRVPDRHFIKFMELLGMQVDGAKPAEVPVTFWLAAPQPQPIIIKAGTTVATVRTGTEAAITFATDEPAVIEVPELVYLMTRNVSLADNQQYNERNVRDVMGGRVRFNLFESEPPAPGDALYLGFANDLSHHVLGLSLEVNPLEGAGIRPENPPYIWEVLNPDGRQDWKPASIDLDTTGGFNKNGIIRLHLPEMQEGSRNEKTAYWVRCRMLSEEESGTKVYQVSPQIHRLATEGWGITIPASNVTLVHEEVLGRSDGTPGQQFYLAHTPVVTRNAVEYLEVRHVDGMVERWQEVNDFAQSQEADKHYIIEGDSGRLRMAPALPQRDGSIKRYGAIPPKNAVLVMRQYRYGGGHTGNVGRERLNVLKTALPFVERVTNRIPARGGLDAESLDDLKLRVPSHLRSLERAVTPQDYEYLALQASPGEVRRAFCVPPQAESPGLVQLIIVPHIPNMQAQIAPESLRVTPELRKTLAEYLDERRLLATRLQIRDADYRWIKTEVHLQIVGDNYRQQVEQDVALRLYRYFNPLIGGEHEAGWAFGRNVTIGDIFSVLRDVPGLDVVRSVKLMEVDINNDRQHDPVEEIVLGATQTIVSYEHKIITESIS